MKVGGTIMKSFAGFLRFVVIRWLLEYLLEVQCSIFWTITIPSFVALDQREMITTAWGGCQKATIVSADGLRYLRYVASGDMECIGARAIADLTRCGGSRDAFLNDMGIEGHFEARLLLLIIIAASL